MRVLVLQGGDGDRAEVGGDIRQVVCPHDRQRTDLFPVKCSVFIIRGTFQQLFPLIDGQDIAGSSIPEHTADDEGHILHILFGDAQFTKILTGIIILNFRLRNRFGVLRHGAVLLPRLLRLRITFAPGSCSSLLVKSMRSPFLEVFQRIWIYTQVRTLLSTSSHAAFHRVNVRESISCAADSLADSLHKIARVKSAVNPQIIHGRG